MGNIFYLMGKSASGKDTIYEALLSRRELRLTPFVMYTTRPIRAGETDGVQYYFVTDEILHQMQERGQVIELRAYHTVHGIWYYFTADSEQVDLRQRDYLALGTLESFAKMRDYYGKDRVVPIYIEVEDGLRLMRAIQREKLQAKPEYEEMCRRFLADQRDFSEEKLKEAGITKKYFNNGDRQSCIDEAASDILNYS